MRGLNNHIRLFIAVSLAAFAIQISIVYMAWVYAFIFDKDLFGNQTTIHWFVLSAIPLAVFITIFIGKKNAAPKSIDDIEYYCSRFMRVFLFAVLMVYVFDKFNGMFFTTSIRQLDTPLGEIRGLPLCWRFYEYSPLMKNFVITTQLIGGILILFNRYTNIAALTLVIVFTNIVIIAFGHHVHLEMFTICMLLISFYLLLLDYKRLSSVFIKPAYSSSLPIYFTKKSTWGWAVFEIIYAVFFIIFLSYREYKIINSYDESVLPIAGVWKVDKINSNYFNFSKDSLPQKLYIETDGEFKMPDGKIKSIEIKLDSIKKIAILSGMLIKNSNDTLKYAFTKDTALQFFSNKDSTVLQLLYQPLIRYKY